MPTRKKSAPIPRQQEGDGATVSQLDREGVPAGCIPIPGMKDGWFFRRADRMILHQHRKGSPLLHIGEVPKVAAVVEHLADDGENIRSEYLLTAKRQRRGRLVTEDELDKGTWSAKTGNRRPTGPDERHAFAKAIRMEADDAPTVAARTFYDTESGDLVLPGADAQAYGYRTQAGTEKAAQAAWEEIGAYAVLDPKAALVMGAMFSGPMLDTLGVLAHILNLYGPGQQGKSTAIQVCAALFGNIRPRRQQLLMTWNSSKQGITQNLRGRGFLPCCIDEHSSSGRTPQQASGEFSQIVSGCFRAMGTADGSIRDWDGFWHSVLVSSSNQPLKFRGQTEDLASRLLEIQSPFFPHAWVDSEGNKVSADDKRAEHVAKRLKRLARDHGGWPIEWALKAGAFTTAKLAEARTAHLELCSKHAPRTGGIPDTIAEIHMAWVVGAHVLGKAIGVPELGPAAEKAAADRLGQAAQAAAETNVPDGERLWRGLDALRLEASAFPEMEDLPRVAAEVGRKPKGFVRSDRGEWWVLEPVVEEAAVKEGVENVLNALRQLADAEVFRRGDTGHLGTRIPKPIRGKGLTSRMLRFNVDRAEEVFGGPADAAEDGDGGQGDGGTGHQEPTEVPGDAPAETVFVPTQVELSMSAPEAEPVPTVEAGMPALVREVTEPRWDELVDAGFSAAKVGVLAGTGLHLPNMRPVPVPMPGNVEETYALMAAYDVRTLYVHASAIEAMGLPAYDIAVHGELVKPHEHPWAAPVAGGVVERVEPAGLSFWMTAIPAEGERREISIPVYDPSRLEDSFGAAVDGAALLDAVMLFLLSSRGTGKHPKVERYYRNVNMTAMGYAGMTADLARCEAIRLEQIPQFTAGQRLKPIVHLGWNRRMEPPEREAKWLHRYDKTAAWLSAWSNTPLGVGEPTHYADGVEFDPKKAGLWRVAEVPGFGLPGLPIFQLRKAEEGGWWVRSTPAVILLMEAYRDWTPVVLEALVWKDSRRVMETGYDRIRLGREFLLAEVEAGRETAALAKRLNGALYKSGRGYLERNEPERDHLTGEIYARKIYRPDWAAALQDAAISNTWRDLRTFSQSRRFPLTLETDAITMVSDEADPVLAAPPGMKLGNHRGGLWTVEGSAPVSALLPLMEDPRKTRHAGEALRIYMKRQGV
ncbi:DUF927 domain-containing protein [Kitasatospora sp. NPDC058162]|uniref:DUF927 domain-containing protein n=1 Tax=Kitasatospora sp. NPDC058162 TaxID=3346362 RepID=UPI0036DEE6F8